MKKQLSFSVNEHLVPIYRFAVLMAIYSVLRVAFYLFNTELFPNVTPSGFANLLYGGLRFDLSALTYLNILYFVLHYLSFDLKFRPGYRRTVNAIFYTLNGVGIAANCIDFIYYRFILKRTTYNVLDILANEDNMGGLWLQFIADYWYVALFFVCTMVLFVLATCCARTVVTPIGNRWVRAALSVVVFAGVAALSVAAIRGGFRHSTRPIAMSNAAAYTASPEESAIVLNTPFTFIRTIGKKGFDDVKYFDADSLSKVFTPLHNGHAVGVPMKRMNVVIFIMESFSREFLGCLNPQLEAGQYKGYTPFLDSLAQHSYVFANAYANGRKSIDAMPSVLAAIPSLTLPYVVSQYSANKVNSIASVLGAEGYNTAFFHGAPNGSMGFDGFAKIAGFQRYLGKNEYNNDDDYDGIWGIWDHAFFQFYAQELDAMQEPFCTALFSLSSHHPFKVPQQFAGQFPQGPLPVEECIAYSDHALRLFFEKARTMPWFSNTLFVITADHSSIPDHEEYKNNAQAFAIPILFYAPSDDTLRGFDTQLAQQTDIMPSVLAYLNYDKPFVAFGNNLFDPSQQRFVVNYSNDVYQIIMNDTIAYFDGKRILGAYDMKADQRLERNIYQEGSMPEIEAKVKAFVQQYNSRMINDKLTAQ